MGREKNLLPVRCSKRIHPGQDLLFQERSEAAVHAVIFIAPVVADYLMGRIVDFPRFDEHSDCNWNGPFSNQCIQLSGGEFGSAIHSDKQASRSLPIVGGRDIDLDLPFGAGIDDRIINPERKQSSFVGIAKEAGGQKERKAEQSFHLNFDCCVEF